jgi:hypothetical protein
MIGKIKNSDEQTFDSYRFPVGFNSKYAGVYVVNVPVDECEAILRTPRLGQEIKAAIEWRIALKKNEMAR